MSISTSQRRNVDEAATPLTRASVPAPGATPESFLASAAPPRGFWARDGRWSAWCGSVLRLGTRPGESSGRIAALARDAAGRLASRTEGSAPPRLFGGFAFYGDHRAVREWTGFPAARFDLPGAVLAGGDREETRLVVTVAGSGRAAREEAARRAEALAARAAGAAGLGRADREAAGVGRAGRGARAAAPSPGRGSVGIERTIEAVSREAWCRRVEEALEEIGRGRFRKVVLARPLDVVLERPPDVTALLGRLRSRAEGSFPFLLEPVSGSVFLGASPELVAVRSGGRFHAMAVAGTAPRSSDPDEDARLGEALMGSAKNRTEHAIGVEDMRERLVALGAAPEVDESPHLLRLRGIQHLRTDLSVPAGPGGHVLDLLQVMHPTAAVCGYPREPAAAFLREREGFARGWYAGPVGWFDPAGEGTFAPALRCAVLQGARARLFAGAGLVEGSDPGREWEETELKLRPVLDILGDGPGA